MNEITIHCGSCTRTFPFCHPSVTRAAQLVNLSILCPHCKVELVMPAAEAHFVPRRSESLNSLEHRIDMAQGVIDSLDPVPPADKRQAIAGLYGASLEKQVEIMNTPTPKVMPPHPPEKPAEVIPIDRPRKPRTRRPHLGQRPFQGLKDLLDPS